MGAHRCFAIGAELAELIVSADAALLTRSRRRTGAAVLTIVYVNANINGAFVCRHVDHWTNVAPRGNLLCLLTAHVQALDLQSAVSA